MATVQAIQHMRKQLIAATAPDKQNHPEAISILQRLKAEVVATDELLRETKIGITVNKLRNYEVKEVADLAKELVRKWKGDVGQSGTKKIATAGAGSASTSTSNAPSPSPAPKASPTPSSASTSAPAAATVTTTTTTVPGPDPIAPPPPPTARRQSSGGPPRTHKSDGVKFNDGSKGDTGDKTREKCCELIYDALAQDSGAPSDLIFSRARALEKHVWTQNPPPAGTAAYRNKMRSFYLNLKAANNPTLREDVVSGEISVVALYEMDPKDMASDERKAENRKLVAENLFKAQAAAPQQAETDAFQCGKCKQRRTMYYQMQTRSADEPMTTFVTCLSCQNRWKFS